MDAKTAREVYGDGSFGGRYRVPEETMQEIFDAAMEDILQLLKFDYKEDSDCSLSIDVI